MCRSMFKGFSRREQSSGREVPLESKFRSLARVRCGRDVLPRTVRDGHPRMPKHQLANVTEEELDTSPSGSFLSEALKAFEIAIPCLVDRFVIQDPITW